MEGQAENSLATEMALHAVSRKSVKPPLSLTSINEVETPGLGALSPRQIWSEGSPLLTSRGSGAHRSPGRSEGRSPLPHRGWTGRGLDRARSHGEPSLSVPLGICIQSSSPDARTPRFCPRGAGTQARWAVSGRPHTCLAEQERSLDGGHGGGGHSGGRGHRHLKTGQLLGVLGDSEGLPQGTFWKESPFSGKRKLVL